MKESTFVNKAGPKNPDEDFIGVLKEWKPVDNGRKVPVIRKKANNFLEWFKNKLGSGEKTLDYLKVKDEDIDEYHVGPFDHIELRNRSGIPGISETEELESSEKDKQLKDKNKKIENLKRKVRNLEDEVERLEEREEEREKREKSGKERRRLECPKCGTQRVKRAWDENQGFCPECGRSSIEEAMEVK